MTKFKTLKKKNSLNEFSIKKSRHESGETAGPYGYEFIIINSQATLIYIESSLRIQ